MPPSRLAKRLSHSALPLDQRLMSVAVTCVPEMSCFLANGFTLLYCLLLNYDLVNRSENMLNKEEPVIFKSTLKRQVNGFHGFVARRNLE